jgi:hypothetical protein
MNRSKFLPVKYGTRFGCRFGVPHDMIQISDTPTVRVEKCRICQKRFRWPKGYKGRVHNAEYLQAHVRQFAQPHGTTRRVYAKLYTPEKCIIKI